MLHLVLDFESYYDTKSGYTLNTKQGGISMLEYIRSPQFKAFGLSYRWLECTAPAKWVTAAEIPAWAKTIKWEETVVIAHNAKFDGAILGWIYGVYPARYTCTQAMARAVLGSKVNGHSLAKVAEHFGFPPKGHMETDGILNLTPEQEATLAEYGCHDTDLCAMIYGQLREAFPVGQLEDLDWTIRCFVEPKLILSETVLSDCNVAEKARRSAIFQAIGIDKKVFSSNEKFSELLTSRGYEVPMKKSPKKKDADGNAVMIPALAVGDTAFQEMIQSDNDELADLCEARVAAKSNLLETRSAKLLRLCQYGAFPFDVNFSGAHTHRGSGGSGAGGNPQNFTQCRDHKGEHYCKGALRRAIQPPEGYKLLVADFAAIEARLVAWLAREGLLVEDFTNGKDVYCSFGTRIYQREITKADKRERQFAKTCVLGLGYQMGAKKFKYKVRLDTGMDISEDEAKRVVNLYRNVYGRIPALWDTLQHFIPYIAKGNTVKIPGMPFLEIRDHKVILPSGLALQYPNLREEIVKGKWYTQWMYDVWDKGHIERRSLYGGKLLENISQALAGELLKLAIRRARAAGLVVVGQVHDEGLALVKTEDVANGKAMLQEAMETPIPWWPTLKVNAEVGAGSNWLEAKP